MPMRINYLVLTALRRACGSHHTRLHRDSHPAPPRPV